jgi:hypothetical protein
MLLWRVVVDTPTAVMELWRLVTFVVNVPVAVATDAKRVFSLDTIVVVSEATDVVDAATALARIVMVPVDESRLFSRVVRVAVEVSRLFSRVV